MSNRDARDNVGRVPERQPFPLVPAAHGAFTHPPCVDLEPGGHMHALVQCQPDAELADGIENAEFHMSWPLCCWLYLYSISSRNGRRASARIVAYAGQSGMWLTAYGPLTTLALSMAELK